MKGSWVRARLCKLQKGCFRLAVASDKVYQLLAHGRWFSPGTPVSSATKTGRHDIAEILLKVALNTIKQIKSINHGKSGHCCDSYTHVAGSNRFMGSQLPALQQQYIYKQIIKKTSTESVPLKKTTHRHKYERQHKHGLCNNRVSECS